MRKGYPEEMKTEVKRLREQGFSYAAIADRVNVSVGTVIKWLKGANLPKATKAPKAPKTDKATNTTKAVVKAPAPPKPTKKNSSEATCCRVPSPAQLKKLNDLKTRLLKLAGKLVQAAEKIN